MVEIRSFMDAMRNISTSSSTDYGLTKNTKRATGTRMNPNGSTKERGEAYSSGCGSGDAPRLSDATKLMQQPMEM